MSPWAAGSSVDAAPSRILTLSDAAAATELEVPGSAPLVRTSTAAAATTIATRSPEPRLSRLDRG